MKIVKYIVDLILIILFIIVGMTGIIIFPELLYSLGFNLNSFGKAQIYQIHHWIGLLLFIFAGIHIDLHWQWLVAMTKHIIKKRKKKELKSFKKPGTYIVDIALFISISFVITTGLIKFPGFLPFLRINPLAVPLNELSFIHDWSGVISVILGLIHIVQHFKRIASTTKHYIHLTKNNKINGKRFAIVFAIIIATSMTLVTFSDFTPIAGITEDIFGTTEDTVTINGIGRFTYNPNEIQTIREDIFNNGHFSVFDILINLHNQGLIDMGYHFDESMNTHIIDSINGLKGWWYEAYYDGGWSENNVFRMDHYPFKENMKITLFRKDQSKIDNIYDVFTEEMQRKEQNGGIVIIPRVRIRGTKETLTFYNVEVSPHNLRNDVFQDDVITAIDVIMTLNDQNKISSDLQWYDSVGTARVVRSYFIDGINDDKTVGRCGFVYEEGSYQYSGFNGNHIHIVSDSRVLNSPEYEEWFWICI